jgi:S-adenosylmethionine-dependent methyltransferase
MYEQYFVKDREKLQNIEQALLTTYFAAYDHDFLESGEGRQDIDANVYQRYNNALSHVVPWVAHHIDLQGKKLVEIGCGTGSSTAAFAHFVQEITAYDIDAQAVKGARARLDVMGIDNVELRVVNPEGLVSALKEQHRDGVDIILLFAVLEHQTIPERLETIALCWDLLPSDGLLVVTETPNLLNYTDAHTSLLPFLHLLPSELYARYAEYSNRRRFNTSFSKFEQMSLQELDTAIMRWGRGVSYHDFELAMGPEYGSCLVANGFEEEILSWFEVTFEEELLRQYFSVKELNVPLAFSRMVLNLIFKKNNSIDCKPDKVPKNKYISDMYTVTEQEIYINTLLKRLAAAEERFHNLQTVETHCFRKMPAAFVRKIKNVFFHS